MNPQNDKFRDFLGVTAWHKAGYTGKRVVCGSAENFINAKPTDHAALSYAVAKEFAPDVEILYLPPFGDSDEAFMSEQIQTMIDRKVCCWFMSLALPIDGTLVNSAFEKVKDFCAMFCGTGNEGANSYVPFIRAPLVYGVGAYSLINGVPVPEMNSSETEFADFSGPAWLHVNGVAFDGVSCATPVLCGMAALVDDYFIDKTGKPLTSGMMYQFLFDNRHDFYTEGKDTKTGWGYVVLPDPETIDIGRYAPLEIKMQIGSNKMTVNGVEQTLDQAPIIAQSGRTLAPVRAVFEAAGLTVEWNALTKTITATR